MDIREDVEKKEPWVVFEIDEIIEPRSTNPPGMDNFYFLEGIENSEFKFSVSSRERSLIDLLFKDDFSDDLFDIRYLFDRAFRDKNM